MLAGLDWIVANHPAGTPGVVNLSLGSNSPVPAVQDFLSPKINDMANLGFVMVVAAGNSNADACAYSPSRATNALTVGATQTNDSRATSFSNFGACLDVFAPGTSIRSLQWNNPAGSMVMQGTSMAAPHVAGVAALAWGVQPSASAQTITSQIIDSSLVNVVGSAGAGSPNRLLNLGTLVPIPGAVQNLRVTANTGAALTLDWDAPATSGGSPITDYIVSYQFNGGTTFWPQTTPLDTLTEYTFVNPSPNIPFVFRVQAVNSFGASPGATVAVTSAAATPSAVQNLRVTVNNGSTLTLDWDAPANAGATPITDYVVSYQFNGGTTFWPQTTPVDTTTEYTFVNPSPNIPFVFRVQAVNSFGASPGATVAATSAAASPSAVQNLSVTANTGTTLTLDWDAPANAGATPITDYVISYQFNGGTTFWSHTTPVDTLTEYTFVNPSPNIPFVFRVQAVNSFGASPGATVAVRSAAATPSAVQNLRVTANTGATLTLDWDAPLNAGAAPITDYIVSYQFNGGTTFWSHVTPVDTTTEYTFVNPSPNIPFVFRVQAVNSFGASPGATVAVRSAAATPSAVQNLRVTANTGTTLTLDWDAPANAGAAPITDYIVSYQFNGGTTFWSHVTPVDTTTEYTFVNPSPNIPFVFRVQAVNSFGASPGATVAVRSAAATPSAVQNLRVTANTGTTLTLDWDAPANAGAAPITDYIVSYQFNGGTTFWSHTTPVDTLTEYTFVNPSPNIPFVFRVQAVNSFGASPGATVAVRSAAV